MLAPTFQHPGTDKGGEAIFHLLSCQVHEDEASPKQFSQKKPHRPHAVAQEG